MTGVENLGRSVYSRRSAKKARQPQPIPEAFLVSRSDDKISTDRLDHAHRTKMAEIASKRGHERRDGPREFHGWAIVTVNDASANGRWVMESPLDDNPYHSDIYMELPEGDERRDMQKEHSVNLAANATWEDAP